MRRGTFVVAIVLVAIVVAYGIVSWMFSDLLVGGRFPSSPAAAFAEVGLPEPEEVSFESDGHRLRGWAFANPSPAGCGVILQHGFTGDRAEVLGAAPLFWERGCHILAYDLRSHGESSPAILTYGALDRHDQSRAIDVFAALAGLAPDRIGLMGWSYGAATAIQTASIRDDIAFVIADASYSSLEDIAAHQASERFGAWAAPFVPGALLVSGLRGGFDPAAASPARAIADVAVPVLLIHSTTDEFTPSSHSEVVYANADPSRTRLALTEWGAPHALSYPTDPDAYERIVADFLAEFAPDFGEAPRPGGESAPDSGEAPRSGGE